MSKITQHKAIHPMYDRSECGSYSVVLNWNGTMDWDFVTCQKCLEIKSK